MIRLALLLVALAALPEPVILDHSTDGSGWFLREATENSPADRLTFRLLLWTQAADSVQIAVVDSFGVARQITIAGGRSTSIAMSLNRLVDGERVVTEETSRWTVRYYATPFTVDRTWGETLVGEYTFVRPTDRPSIE